MIIPAEDLDKIGKIMEKTVCQSSEDLYRLFKALQEYADNFACEDDGSDRAYDTWRDSRLEEGA